MNQIKNARSSEFPQPAKKAHDDLLRAADQVQGDAAEIEHGAIARLAEEYSAAQERGEVGQSGARSDLVPDGNEVAPSAADLGLSRKTIHQGRIILEAEKVQPGIVHHTVKDLIERGEAPTKAAIGAVVRAVAGRPPSPPRAPASPPAAAPKREAPLSPDADDAAKAAAALRQFIVATNELAKVDFAALAGGFPPNRRAELVTRCRPYLDRFEMLDKALEGRGNG